MISQAISFRNVFNIQTNVYIKMTDINIVKLLKICCPLWNKPIRISKTIHAQYATANIYNIEMKDNFLGQFMWLYGYSQMFCGFKDACMQL